MTPEEMRIAIAESQGWGWWIDNSPGAIPKLTKPRDDDQKRYWLSVGCCITQRNGSQHIDKIIPDFCNDWNAVHAAVNSLNEKERLQWLMWMDKITSRRSKQWFPYRLLTSNIPEWNESYLLTKGLYK